MAKRKRQTDREIFFQHRRKLLTGHWRHLDPQIQTDWNGLGAQGKIAEARRIRNALDGGQNLAQVPLPQPAQPNPPLNPVAAAATNILQPAQPNIAAAGTGAPVQGTPGTAATVGTLAGTGTAASQNVQGNNPPPQANIGAVGASGQGPQGTTATVSTQTDVPATGTTASQQHVQGNNPPPQDESDQEDEPDEDQPDEDEPDESDGFGVTGGSGEDASSANGSGGGGVSDASDRAPMGEHVVNFRGVDENQQAEHRRGHTWKNPPRWGNAEWKAAEMVGEGGNGVAVLFIAGNEKGEISRRVVVKDTWVDEDAWGSVRTWYGNPRDRNDRTPLEIRAMQKLRVRPGSENRVTQIHHSSVDDDNMRYRIIMNYCPYGSLKGTVLKYSIRKQPVPEAFIWCIFDALAEACLFMERGKARGKKAHSWEEIMHRDMKPSNVFLDTESTTSFPLYPKPILADFGCCLIKQSPDDVPIATYADGQGTPGYLAPETVPRYDRATGAPSPLASQGSWTNVFGAGAIISRIMTRTVTPKGPTYESGFEEYDWLEGGNATSIYSEELCQLVRRCVRYRPDERITAAQLRRKIRKYSGLQGDDDEYVDLTDGMRTKTVENDPRLLLSFKKDGEYTQGFAL